MATLLKLATLQKIVGVACKILGIIASLTAIMLFRFDRALPILAPDFVARFPDEGAATAVAYSLTVVLFVIGIFLFWLGRQLRTLARAETVREDSQPTLLYLRLFSADPSLRKQVFGQLISLLFPGARFAYLVTAEEQLAEELRPLGNLTAFGRPGEALPRPGAAPLYVSMSEWKEAVISHMRTARLVILRAGSSTSLLWELEEAAKIVPPSRLLILFLRLGKGQYTEFCAAANNIFEDLHGISLPQIKAQSPRRLSGFIFFSKDWVPSFHPLEAPYLRRGTYDSYRRMFKFALRPVFEELGVKWQKPRISVVAVGSLIFFALIALRILQYLGTALGR
jgi:hypothetical protein